MDKLPSYVRFKGAFRDLKARGYRFWKAYARNYRVYTKRFNGQEWGQWANIWQHLGGYLEVDKFDSFTYLLVDLVARGEHKKWVYAKDIFDAITKKDTDEEVALVDYMNFFINIKDGSLLVIDETFPYASRPDYFKYHSQHLSDVELDALYKEYNDTWREANTMNYIIKEIEDLLADGLIEVVPDTRKY